MRVFFLWVFLAIFSAGQVRAAAVPVSRTQNALSGVIQTKMANRGFAANDPRWVTTLQTVGSGIGGAAAAAAVVTLAGVTAPAWVTAGAVVGLTALFAAGIDLAIDGVRWLLNPDGTVTVGVTGAGGGSLLVGGAFVRGSAGGYYPAPHTKDQAADDWARLCGNSTECGFELKLDKVTQGTSGSDVIFTSVYDVWDPRGFMVTNFGLTEYPRGSPVSCGPGLVYFQGNCVTMKTPPTGPTPKPVSDAVASISAADKGRAANPILIAALANAAWQKAAASPGYAGLPYDPANPITAGDATVWQAQNPTNWPSVGDLVMPQAAPAGGTASTPFTLPTDTSPVSSTDPSTSPSAGINPSTQPLINLGVDPGIGAPVLESTPTAQAILSPVLGLLPSLKTFVVPAHQSTCPVGSANLFGKQLLLDGHCALTEGARPTLYPVMAFVWLFVALLIILAA